MDRETRCPPFVCAQSRGARSCRTSRAVLSDKSDGSDGSDESDSADRVPPYLPSRRGPGSADRRCTRAWEGGLENDSWRARAGGEHRGGLCRDPPSSTPPGVGRNVELLEGATPARGASFPTLHNELMDFCTAQMRLPRLSP